MPIMPEKTNSEAPFPQQSRGFHGGKDVDIEGVTGSIPVAPTIFPQHLEGWSPSYALARAGLFALPSAVEKKFTIRPYKMLRGNL